MTQEDKELLLKDLCGRLPYNVVINCEDSDTKYKCFLTTDILNEILHEYQYYEYKSYLRPMSSMTDEEKDYVIHLAELPCAAQICEKKVDFFLSHHIDWRGLIEKGLALEAPEDMYKNE